MADDTQDGKKAPADRDAILLRRRKFVVAALSGAAIGLEACTKDPPKDNTELSPQVCLKIAEPPDNTKGQPSASAPATGSTGTGVPAASSAPERPDAGAPDGKPDGGKPDGGKPRICLRYAAPRE